jgi:hypothetical protein
MIESRVHLAYAPRGAGVLYAVLWFAQARDVYGWYIGSRGGAPEASYFMLPGYYSERGGMLYRSLQDDPYGPWVEVRAGRIAPLPHPPVPEPLVHDLARLQDEFVRHWLFFDDEPGNAAEVRALAEQRLPLRHVNIRAARLGKLHTAPAVWRYDAPGTDRNVLVALSQCWPLDEHLTE